MSVQWEYSLNLYSLLSWIYSTVVSQTRMHSRNFLAASQGPTFLVKISRLAVFLTLPQISSCPILAYAASQDVIYSYMHGETTLQCVPEIKIRPHASVLVTNCLTVISQNIHESAYWVDGVSHSLCLRFRPLPYCCMQPKAGLLHKYALRPNSQRLPVIVGGSKAAAWVCCPLELAEGLPLEWLVPMVPT